MNPSPKHNLDLDVELEISPTDEARYFDIFLGGDILLARGEKKFLRA